MCGRLPEGVKKRAKKPDSPPNPPRETLDRRGSLRTPVTPRQNRIRRENGAPSQSPVLPPDRCASAQVEFPVPEAESTSGSTPSEDGHNIQWLPAPFKDQEQTLNPTPLGPPTGPIPPQNCPSEGRYFPMKNNPSQRFSTKFLTRIAVRSPKLAAEATLGVCGVLPPQAPSFAPGSRANCLASVWIRLVRSTRSSDLSTAGPLFGVPCNPRALRTQHPPFLAPCGLTMLAPGNPHGSQAVQSRRASRPGLSNFLPREIRATLPHAEPER